MSVLPVIPDFPRYAPNSSCRRARPGVAAAGPPGFDPARYGMVAEHDEAGNYAYPEGFDPHTNDWLAGYEDQQAAWERQYAEAYARWQAHPQFASRRWVMVGPR